MNDETREKLSAYIDGALSESERRAVDVELSRSVEMSRELEALRAVSAAIKGLPKEKLPAGFMARLDARRAREDSKPAREYFILPPAYRPLAFALSTAVVALVVWDKTHPSTEMLAPRPGWDGEIIAVKTAAEAPPSVDVSGKLASLNGRAEGAAGAAPGSTLATDEISGTTAQKADLAKADASSTFGKHISAPGKPLEQPEPDPILSDAQVAALDALPSYDANGKPYIARNEEERSAINERLYKGFEEEKKKMGIAKIIDKDAEGGSMPSDGRELMTLQSTPEAARVDAGKAVVASARGAAKAKRGGSPTVKAIPLKSAEALLTAWAAAGLAGEPPTVDFPAQMALFLAGPQGCGIVRVEERKRFIVVLYKDSGFDDASARVRAVTFSSRPVVIKPAP